MSIAHEKENEVEAAYHRSQFWPERVKLMEWWAEFLCAKSDKQEKTEKIVPRNSHLFQNNFLNTPGRVVICKNPISDYFLICLAEKVSEV